MGRVQDAFFGNVARRWQRALAFDNLESGVNFGLRHVLPVGPIRLDLAGDPSAEVDEDDPVLHLSVGMAF